MRVLVTGGTGLVGRRLVPRLLERGEQVIVLSRQSSPELPPACSSVQGDPAIAGPWLERLAGCDAVIHLAGENVFARRWRKRFKKKLYDSRIDSTFLIAAELAKHPCRPDGSAKIFVSASAIGYYGPHDHEELDEEDPPGNDFLAEICIDWERAASAAGEAGVRVCHPRIGMVLDDGGGALPKLVRPFRWFLGGPMGSGKQWISWIHVADMVGLLLHALDCADQVGPFNATAPEPLTNWGFCKLLGKVLNRPCWLTVPGFMLRLLIGPASSVVTSGQRVLPRRAVKLGYLYRFPDLEQALRDLLNRPPKAAESNKFESPTDRINL
jgi:uncharacterized protein (TIGR01777 family)